MSATDQDEEGAWPLPRETGILVGHHEAERALFEAYRSGRLPHAWLIGGPPGIGKATLAYRMARFVLAHPDPASTIVQSASSLAVDPSHPVARQVAAQAHNDLLVLERTLNENGVLRSVITVDEVRRTVSFFGSTAGQGGWRVCIVDSTDELNPQGANALLKVVEEPPARALFLLVSHAPGRVIPTIRSRCRRLDLAPLDAADVARATAAASGRSADDPAIAKAATAAQGSVGRALSLLEGSTLALRERTIALLEALPATDPTALHGLGDALSGNDDGFAAFLDAVRDWLSSRLTEGAPEKRRLLRVAEAWDEVNRAAGEVDEFNLERKPYIFAVFGLLAEAARA